MKSFTFFAVTILLMGITGLALAQETPVPPNIFIYSRPPSTADIKQRIKHQKAKIVVDSKVGKLTTLKAADRQADLKSIDDQRKADYSKNGNKELTDDQKVDLTQKLDESRTNIINPKYGEMTTPEPVSTPVSKP